MADYVDVNWMTGNYVNEIMLDRMQSNAEYHREDVLGTRVVFTGENIFQYDDTLTNGWKIEVDWGTGAGIIYSGQGGAGEESITALNIDTNTVAVIDREIKVNIYTQRSAGDVLVQQYDQRACKVLDQRYIHVLFHALCNYHSRITIDRLTVLSSKDILVVG